MRRLTFLLLFFCITLHAQPWVPDYSHAPFQYGTVLNGADYWQNTSPQLCDLNGSEIIAASDDRTFESTVGNWVGVGTTTIVRSTVAHHTGSASGLIAGIGDGTSNYAKLPSAALGLRVINYKYTIEVWNQDITTATALHLKIGTQTLTSATEATGAFGKVVFNYQATASDTGADLIVWMTTATGGYIDDVSLTQAYDGMVVQIFKSSAINGSANQGLFDLGVTSATLPRLFTRLAATTNSFDYLFNDNLASNGVVASGLVIPINTWTVSILMLDRTRNMTPYVGGAAGATFDISIFGKMTGVGQITLGYKTPTASANTFLNGLESETQYVRFNNITPYATSIVAQISATKKCLPSYPNQVTGGGWWKWQNGGSDSWGLNPVNPVGGAYTTRVKY